MTFLLPYYLLLLFVPLIFWISGRALENGGAWAKVCDAHLLPFLTIRTGGKENKLYRYLMLFIWSIASICAAGPALEIKDAPSSFAQSGLVVVVDMSPAMDNQAAGQMTRKLYDLLEVEKDTAIGLVLVDSKAYTALPITMDKSVFKNIIPDLKERIMPTTGQNIDAGISKAGELLMQSGFKNGQILLITAGVDNENKLKISLDKSPYPVYVLGVGNQKDIHPVTLQNGQFWGGEKPILVGVKNLPAVLNESYKYATLDESDLKFLLKNARLDKIEQSPYTVKQYQNFGIYAVLLLLPLTALLFRRGVLWVLLICLFCSPASAGFWWRTEQELYQKQMQGIADFNIGQYDKAQANFANVAPFDIEALYNLATAQAYAGKLQEAIESYEKVLAQNPNHADAAYNLKYLKKQLPPPPPPEQSQQQSGQQEKAGEVSQNQNNENSQNNSAGQEQQAAASSDDKNEENQAENSSDGDKGQDGENASSKAQPQSSNSDESSQDEAKENNGQEQQPTPAAAMPDGQQDSADNQQAPLFGGDQKQQEWLDKINPDAGRVLRYRLLRQYQEQQ